jgi:hypothetical protein
MWSGIVADWIAAMDAANATTPEQEARIVAWAAELEMADNERVATWIAELEAAALRLGWCPWRPAPRPIGPARSTPPAPPCPWR